MAKNGSRGLQVVTANELRTGRVVFFGRAGRWISNINDADTAQGVNSAAELLARAQCSDDASGVVELSLIEACADGGTIRPIRLREEIRAKGPTVAFDSAGPR